MTKHIKIFEKNGKYCFSINDFYSIRHSQLTQHAEEYYRYAWEAQRDARNLAEKHAYHIKTLEKFAFEDLSKPIIEDIAAERRLADHYDAIYDGLVDIANGMEEGDKNQRKVNYFEAKAVIQEILFIVEEEEEDELADEDEKKESETRLTKVIGKVKKLVKKYYRDELAADKKKSEEEDAEAQPDMGMGGEMGGMEGMGGMEAPMPMPMASTNSWIKIASSVENVSDDVKMDLIKDYCEKACLAIENKHPEVICSSDSSGITLKSNGTPIIHLSISEDLFLEDIQPVGEFKKMYPYHGTKFYQSYWKPIVEKIGHCCIGNGTDILCLGDKVLPDTSNKSNTKYQTMNKKSKNINFFEVSFRGDPEAWFVKEVALKKSASAKYSKDEYYKNGKGAMVVCIDPTLKSYYKQTGQVVQVIPFDKHLEVDIDFGHNVFRMVESQFEILNGL